MLGGSKCRQRVTGWRAIVPDEGRHLQPKTWEMKTDKQNYWIDHDESPALTLQLDNVWLELFGLPIIYQKKVMKPIK